VDDFEQVNDHHGHHIGDAYLKVAGERLPATARATDSVGRLGGDEFVVLFEWAGSSDEVLRLAHRVQQALAAPVRIEGIALEVQVSIGIRLAAPGETAERVLRDADAATYAAKAGRKARSTLHDGTTMAHGGRRNPLEVELAAALDADEIDVWLQPVVRLSDGRPTGVEALARWHTRCGDRSAGRVRAARVVERADQPAWTGRRFTRRAGRPATGVSSSRTTRCR